MLDIKYIRDHTKEVKATVKARSKKVDIDQILKLDRERRELISKTDSMRAEQKKISSLARPLSSVISDARRAERGAQNFGIQLNKTKKLKEETKKLEERLKKAEDLLAKLLPTVPNIPLPDVPIGKDEKDNEIVRVVGKPVKFSFEPKDHLTLGETLGIIDVERAVKVSGSRFNYLKGGAAYLQMALIHYTYDLVARDAGFVPLIPPVIIKEEIARGSGHPEATSEEAYHLEKDNLYLVGTCEQSILPMYKDEILNDARLPARFLGYSTSFRREAGSYGRDLRGILRQHQFDKLEMFVFCQPENSEKEHQNIVALQEKLMQGLSLPYRVVKLCTGDMGFPSAKTYDIESWMPSQNKYRETHSSSNCTDYQARNLNIKYQRKDGKKEFVHTLNGTAFAIGRILIAILENYQQKDGNVLVPQELQKYCGFKVIKK